MPSQVTQRVAGRRAYVRVHDSYVRATGRGEVRVPITASQLRADVYNLLDRVIESGEPLEIERNGVVVRLVPPRKAHWLDRLPRRHTIVGDPDDIVHLDWSEHWNPDPT